MVNPQISEVGPTLVTLNIDSFVRFEVSTAVPMMIIIFWEMIIIIDSFDYVW
jgi:hypothetical protein